MGSSRAASYHPNFRIVPAKSLATAGRGSGQRASVEVPSYCGFGLGISGFTRNFDWAANAQPPPTAYQISISSPETVTVA
jgi:hypothetical protein